MIYINPNRNYESRPVPPSSSAQVQTRLRKLQAGDVKCTLLAYAGRPDDEQS